MKASTRAEIDRLWNEPLPAEEFARRLAKARAELDGEEGEQLRALIQWFRRRYPTPISRARYLRRKLAGKRG